MDAEKLIESVRAYSGLYDLSDKKYSDSTWKEKTWKLIGEELNQPASTCKARWINIRDQFRKITNKKRTSSDQAAIKIPKYKFEEQLSFLTPYFHERSTVSSFGTEGSETEGEGEGEGEGDGEGDGEEECEDKSMTCFNEPIGQTSVPVDSHNKVMNRKHTKKTTETASSTVMKYLLEKKNVKEQKKETDPVDAFLLGTGSTMKTFDPYFLNLAKSKIFNIVQDMEMQQILRKQNPVPQINVAASYNVHPIWKPHNSRNYPLTGTNIEGFNYQPTSGADSVLEHRRSYIPTSEPSCSTHNADNMNEHY